VANEEDASAPGGLELLTRVMGLAIACPFSQDNPDRCQLCEIRSRPLPERIAWMRSLSPAERERVTVGHDECLRALQELSGRGGDETA